MLIKVCGMRDANNILDVAACGIQWMGFIFYPCSPRYFQAGSIEIPENIRKVGVFVHAGLSEMLSIYDRYKLDYLQLHGNESPESCRRLREEGCKIIKAISVSSEEDVCKTKEYESVADYFLFDTRCAGYGGSGQTFDWSVLEHYEGQVPFLLSGGIRIERVPQLLRFHHPRLVGFDLNSGFELAPGLKDAKLIQSFINQIRQTYESNQPNVSR